MGRSYPFSSWIMDSAVWLKDLAVSVSSSLAGTVKTVAQVSLTMMHELRGVAPPLLYCIASEGLVRVFPDSYQIRLISGIGSLATFSFFFRPFIHEIMITPTWMDSTIKFLITGILIMSGGRQIRTSYEIYAYPLGDYSADSPQLQKLVDRIAICPPATELWRKSVFSITPDIHGSTRWNSNVKEITVNVGGRSLYKPAKADRSISGELL